MSGTAVALLRLARPHQWSKNLLVFLSLIAGHQYADPALLSLSALCFLSFCLVASAGYVVNDLADQRDDRAHARKSARPIAAGQVSARLAFVLAGILLGAGLTIASFLPRDAALCIVGYLAATQLYTFWARKKLMLDVVFLAGLYTLRIIAGVAVSGSTPSFWLLAFSMFLFFSLASLKRFIEIVGREPEALAGYSARAYRKDDGQMIAMLGIASGMLAVLVFAFYINSREVMRLYAHPALLWLACPLLLYWIARAWMLASRQQVHDDPIVFALRDPSSYLLLVLLGAIVVLAT
jgi:4-hydroxybenzoate polyprenyltransferase